MELTSEFHGLIQSSHGTLSEYERSEVVEFVEAREFNLALEALCGFLQVENRRVPPDLYIRIRSLVERLDGVDPYILESVKVSD
jgi:hypothetical protein